MKQGIIFDMDGTLWDSAENVAASWNIAVSKCGYQRALLTKEDMYAVMGLTMDRIAEELFPDVPTQELPVLLEACCREENDYLLAHGGELYPGLRKTMEQLRALGCHLYIVSNCQSGYIEAFLDYYGFHDLIEDKQCYGDNGLQKADNIRILFDRNELDRAVYVGDIQGDYDSAVSAGVDFIHAAYGFGTVNALVPVISGFEELPQAVCQWML